MIYFFILLMLVIIYKMTIDFKNSNKEYMSKENTTCIKGIFIIIVFISHIRQYQLYDSVIDLPAINILSYLGQLMVTMFMFYSGYGVYESIKNKSREYIKKMPKNRILKTYFLFVISIISFIICNLLLNNAYSLRENIMSFTGWSGIGNSAWYIFSIIVLYILTYISFTIFKKDKIKALILNTLLVIGYIIVMSFLKPPYWCNTCLCYAAGMWYSQFIDKINKALLNNNKKYIITLLIVIVLVILSHAVEANIPMFSIYAVLFALLIVMLTIKININNKILFWLGKNLFWVYILQRIPMMIFQTLKINEYNRYVYFGVSFVATIILVAIYEKLVPIIESKIFNKREKTKLKTVE